MFICSLCFVYLIMLVFADIPDKEYSDLLSFPLIQNPANPNYYEISVIIDGSEYSLPLNLMNNSIQIPLNTDLTNVNDITPISSFSLFENFSCARETSPSTAETLTLTSSNHANFTFNAIPFHTVTQYEPECTYYKYFGLSKTNSFIKQIHDQQPSLIKVTEFSISLDTFGKGVFLIGEHMELLKGNEPLFCRPIEEPAAAGRWGCQMRGALPEDNLRRLSVDGVLKVNTDLRSGKEYFLTAKKTAASDRYQSFYFDMNFQYILSTYKFLVYLKNFYFKQFIANNTCEITNNTALNVLAFYCSESILTSLQPIHFLIGYRSVKFTAEELFVKDKDVNGDKCYMFQVVGRNNKRGSEWIFGHPLFKRYTVMFNQESEMIYIFSQTVDFNIDVEYIYTPPKSSSVPDIDIDVEEDLFDININGQNDEMGVDVDKNRFNRSKLIAFSVGMLCCGGIFYLLYYRVSYARVKIKDININNEFIN